MDETDKQAIKNYERLNRHSEKLNELYTHRSEDHKLLKEINDKLSDEFIKQMKELYRWAKVDNGTLSMNSWRRDMEEFVAAVKHQVSQVKEERKKWVTLVATFVLGALVNWLFVLVSKWVEVIVGK